LINKSKLIVSGALKDVKSQYSSDTYAIQFKGIMMAFANALWTGYELIKKEQIDEDHAIAYIKMKNGNKVNDLLKAVMPSVEVQAIHKVEPSMHDIFLKAVGGEQGGNNE
jgi:ABC-2 type transport system ATP-binding protein